MRGSVGTNLTTFSCSPGETGNSFLEGLVYAVLLLNRSLVENGVSASTLPVAMVTWYIFTKAIL